MEEQEQEQEQEQDGESFENLEECFQISVFFHVNYNAIYTTKVASIFPKYLILCLKVFLHNVDNGVIHNYLQHSPLDDIISDQSSTMDYCLIKNLAKENPVGKKL